MASSCDDGNACTLDACNFALGACVHKAIAGCPFGCQGDNDPSCNDGFPCTIDKCDAGSGKCSHTSNGESKCCSLPSDCTDASECQVAKCVGSQCVYVTNLKSCCSGADCDDANSCTMDVCNVATHVCSHVLTCNCDLPCVAPDACSTASCEDNLCIVKPIADCCLSYLDCSGGELCKMPICKNSKCSFIDNPFCCVNDVDCDDSSPETVDSCDLATNTCVHQNSCWGFGSCGTKPSGCKSTACVDGACIDKPIANCCLSDLDCDDLQPCTMDVCNYDPSMQYSTCKHSWIDGCTIGCIAGACDDGNPCTTDTCSGPGICTNTPIAACAIPCDVTNCSVIGNCIEEACDSTGQCVHTDSCGSFPCKSSFDCQDGSACTADICTTQGCVFKEIFCDDSNPCTLDGCGVSGCTHLFVPGCTLP